jgi:hypothetical protein
MTAMVEGRAGTRAGSIASIAFDALCVCAFAFAAAQLARGYGFYDFPKRAWWWTDAHYNLVRAFYVLKGFLLYDEIPSSQLPGYQSLLAIPLGLLGYGAARPTMSLLDHMEAAGMYLNAVLQMTVFFVALRVTGFSRALAFVAAILLTYVMWEAYGHILPLVEPLMVAVTALATALLCRLALGPERGLRNDLLLLGMTLSFGAVLGLTAAPTFAFWSAAACAIYLVRSRHRAEPWCGLAPVCFWGVLWLGFMVWTWRATGFGELLYWTVVNPSEGLGISVPEHLKLLFGGLPKDWFRFSVVEQHIASYPLLATRPFGLVVIAVCCGVLWLYAGPQRRERVMIVALGCVLAIGFLLVAWRFPLVFYNHKIVSGLGISIAVLALALRTAVWVPPLPFRFSHAQLMLLAAASVPLAAVLLINGARAYRYVPVNAERDPVLSAAGVCRLGDRGPGCSCLIQATYDPRRFLQLDVQPCLGYSPEQPHIAMRSKKSLAQFTSAIERRDVAFLVGRTSADSTMYAVPEALYDRIVATRVCRPVIDGIFRVCSAN